MICIEDNNIILYLRNFYLELLTGCITHNKWRSHLQLYLFRKLCFWIINDHFLVFLTVGIIRRNIYRLLLSYFHTRYSIIKSFYHHSTTHFKLERLTTFRRIKCFSTCKAAMVMYFYFVTVFYLLHD